MSEITVINFQNELYERVYHKSLQKSWNLNLQGTQIVENPELLSAIEEINEKTNLPPSIKVDTQDSSTKETTKDVPLESPKLNTSILVPANKQLETRLPSGKRRITPMFLTSVPNVNKDNDQTLLQ